MSENLTTVEMRRELQQLLSEERDLLARALRATTSGQYVTLRDTADELVKVAERRVLLRAALVEARSRETADQTQATTRRGTTDQSADTWRLLR